MAKKATITPVTDTVNNAAAINTQLNAINNKLDNTLSLDGSTPNAMGADLDMNSNDLLNVGTLQTNDITVSGDSLTGVLASTGANKDAAAASAASASTSATAASLSATQAAQYDGIWLDDVAALLADTTLTYTAGQPSTVVVGDYVRTRKEGFAYQVATSGDVTTAGGIQLDVLDWNVKALGAKGDGATDDSVAINYGILNAPAALDIPKGTYHCSNILLSRSDIVINGPEATLHNPATDGSPLFTMGATNFRRSVINLYAVTNVALSGDIFDLNTSSFSDNEVTIKHLSNASTNGRILTNQNGAANGDLFFTNFYGHNWTIQAGCTADRQIQVIGDGNLCSVVTFDIRDFRHLSTTGVMCFYFESTSTIGASFNQILLKNFGVEKAQSGLVIFKGCHFSGVENINFYDMLALGATINASLIEFKSGSGGATSEGSYAKNVRRNSGVTKANVYDIECLNDRILLENIGARVSNDLYAVNLGNNRVVVIGSQFTTFSNFNSTRATIVNSSEGVITPLVTTPEIAATKVAVGDGSTLTIEAGVVTATGSYHIVNTEAAAASDDLDTINGGSLGMLLTITAQNNARSVVVKDSTGNLRTVGDFTLDHTHDTISFIYDGTNWIETSRSDNTP